MIEVAPRLFVGSADDYEQQVKGEPGWFVVQAAKEPYHREALGYAGRAAPTDSPEYLYAKRDNRLILNIVDADDPIFFREEMIEQALSFIAHHLRQGRKVLIHCNQGLSRAPSLALLYMHRAKQIIGGHEIAEMMFRDRIYPPYSPKNGIRGYLIKHWRTDPIEPMGEPRPAIVGARLREI